MPLMRCPDCHKEISDAAISCPNCGLPRPLYEFQNRERRAAESLAAADRRRNVQLLYAFAGFTALVAAVIIFRAVLSPWTSAGLATKGRMLLGGGAGCAVAYAFFWFARRLKGSPP
ncbi:MAG: hypothetical protein ABJB33_09460 [Gemmatimonadota bacterium]